jgi:predicted dehydrogenase
MASAPLTIAVVGAGIGGLHMPDGPAREARDAEWARLADRSPEALRWLYTFDADTEKERS